MADLSEYMLETLREGRDFAMYRGWRKGDEVSVLIVAPTDPQLASANVSQLDHEYAFADVLDPAWSARPRGFWRQNGRTMLILEDPGGDLLDGIVGPPIELTRFFRIAIGLAAALRQLHRCDIVHKDIKPANLFVDAAGKVWLTGFGVASRLPRERQVLAPPETISGTFAYMAPEQTGRMNRSIDARADLYSMGITLYEMLAGQPPFSASNPMEWIHCHLARKPPVPSEAADGVPRIVDEIILKLLAKNPEDRYQTAAGVEADLGRCLMQWKESRCIEPFSLGADDRSDQLIIREKLYGRKTEIEALIAAFDRVVASGVTERVLVSGPAGIGKTSVVNEFHKALAPRRGFFVTGKFDQYNRDIPYATLAQALQSLMRQLLGKNESELSQWRSALQDALGPNGQLMINLIPELALVIGEQPFVADLPSQDLQARFLLAFQRLLRVFARPEQPLVIFLDDLQWLDAATSNLLERIVREPEVEHLLVICAYRDNEVGRAHPVAQTLAAVTAARGEMKELRLGPLRSDDLCQFVADALHAELVRVRALADLIHEKTEGNPFFSTQFLTTLVAEKLIVFSPMATAWQWDLNQIHAKVVTDNVADLLSGKLIRLPDITLQALKHFACLGNTARTDDLRAALGLSEEQIHVSLLEAARMGLVVRLDNSYAFAHDRIQEAAYALILDGERAPMHLQIGRAVLSGKTPTEVSDRIFDIVSQLNRASSLVTSVERCAEAARLNLIAGERAKAATAYESALGYFTSAGAFLAEHREHQSSALAFAIELNRAECEFLTGQFSASEERLSVLSKCTASFAELAAVTRLRVMLYTMLDNFDLAVDVGLGYLRDVGIGWSRSPTDAQVHQEWERMREVLGDRPVEQLLDLAPMGDLNWRAAMDVLADLLPPALFTNSNLFDLLLLRMTNLSLEHGNCSGSCYAYASLSMVVGRRFGDYPLGYRFGRLACDLVQKPGLELFKARVDMAFGCLVIPWTKHVSIGRGLIRRSIETANAIGDLTFAVYSSKDLITNLMFSGEPLQEVQQEAESGLAFALKSRFDFVRDGFVGQLMLIRALRGLPHDVLLDAERSEGWFEMYLEKQPRYALAACWYWIHKMQAHFFAQDYATAIEATFKAERLLWSTRSHLEVAEFHFYGALTRAAICDSATSEQREQHMQALLNHHQQIVVWAENCPTNFANRAALVGAEVARLQGHEPDAERLYEKAIRLAREHTFVQNEGLANELASRFYAARGFTTISDAYLQNARSCYSRWGAEGKVVQLDRAHSHLRQAPAARRSRVTVETSFEDLDLATVVKVMQAVSSEIDLKKLIEIVMVTALEHAGGDRSLLILSRDGLWIEAEAAAVTGTIRVTLRHARCTPADLPETVLRYVVRTKDSVLLDDAASANAFLDDEYIQNNRTRSILCLPLTKQAVLVGVLYIENSQTSYAFTPARLAVLKLLASQAAISLENARLYAELRQTEASLSEAQRLTHTGSFTFNMASGRNVWSEEVFRIYEFEPVPEVSMDMLMSRVHPDDHDRIRRFIADTEHDGTEYSFEHRLLMPDGAVKTIHIVTHAVRDESGEINLIGTAMDVTASRQASERLQSSLREMQKLASLIENSSEFIGYTPVGGRVAYLNAAGRRLVGLEMDEDISKFCMSDFHPAEDSRLYLDEILPVLSRDGQWEGERVLRHFKTNAEISVLQTIFFIADEGTNRRTAMATICRDITERKRDMALQRQAEEALQKARAELVHIARLTTMGELAASIAHELNQPLMAVVNSAQTCLLRLSEGRPELNKAREAAERAVTNGHRAGDIIRNIRALIQKSAAVMSPLEINVVVRDVLDLMRAELRRHEISLKLEFSAGLERVMGDRVQLQQIVLNLVMNGIEAMSGITDRQRLLSVATQREESGDILVSVEDAGAGLDSLNVDRMFEPFFTTKLEGMGMGLSICRSIVEAHGGRLWASPRVPYGSIFRFSLPAVTKEDTRADCK